MNAPVNKLDTRSDYQVLYCSRHQHLARTSPGLFGLYSAEGRQVGFARFVTDRTTFGWLCDVFVESPAQGRGLGTFLVETALSHPDVKDIRLVLSADPGRSLYQRQGFTALAKPERLMERRPKPSAP